MDQFEDDVVAGYVANVLRTRGRDRMSLRAAAEWLQESPPGADLDSLTGCDILLQWSSMGGPAADIPSLQRWAASTLLPILDRARTRQRRKPDSLRERNLRALCRIMEFDALDAAVLGFFVRYATSPAVQGLADTLSRSLSATRAVPTMLGIPQRDFVRRIDRAAPLVSSGLLQLNTRRAGLQVSHLATVLDCALAAVEHADGTKAGVRRFLLGEPRAAALQWEDFAFLGDVRDRLATFLSVAVTNRLAGVNILLYGPPGTGKTEFAKALAARVGLSLYAVGQADSEGDKPNREAQLASLRLLQSLARRQKNTVLLFEERDDQFSEELNFMEIVPQKKPSAPKVLTNHLTEDTPLPTLWTVNSPCLLDDAIIRRMGFAVEFKAPPLATREKVWGRTLMTHGAQLTDADVREMARHERVAPTVVEGAVRFGKLVGGTDADIREAAQSIVHAVRGNGAPPEQSAEPFNPALVNPDLDLTRLPELMAAAMSRTPTNLAFSLCLYGPPGTGKSAFVRHLADRVGMSVLMKRASDLLGPYVGQTEQNIARAFEQARDDKQFLVFDEADSFLRDRTRAGRSWEVSHVNEMLTWMESHPLPFACTTNLMQILDEASLRRFTFKVRFGYLGAGQVAEAFRFFFGAGAPAAALALRGLTPGDFTLTRRKAEVLGLLGDSLQLTDLLAKEARLKRSAPKAIGFGAPAMLSR